VPHGATTAPPKTAAPICARIMRRMDRDAASQEEKTTWQQPLSALE
jgi:hypothetical protein